MFKSYFKSKSNLTNLCTKAKLSSVSVHLACSQGSMEIIKLMFQVSGNVFPTKVLQLTYLQGLHNHFHQTSYCIFCIPASTRREGHVLEIFWCAEAFGDSLCGNVWPSSTCRVPNWTSSSLNSTFHRIQSFHHCFNPVGNVCSRVFWKALPQSVKPHICISRKLSS